MADSAEGRTGRRGGGSVSDMIRTILIFVAIAIALVAIIPRHVHDDPTVSGIDVPSAAAAVQGSVSWHVYVASGLPSNWQPNHAIPRVAQAGQPVASLDVGYYISKADNYAAVEQSSAPNFLTAQLGASAVRTGTVTVAGSAYTSYQDSHGRPALVRAVTGSLLVLDGQATAAQLQTLAAALR